MSEVMQRSWSARSSHVPVRSVVPVIRSVARFGVVSQRRLPSAVYGILPSSGSMTSDVRRLRCTRPLPDSSQISLNSPLVAICAETFFSVVASAFFSASAASCFVKNGLFASAAGRSSGTGV